jgi:hypothetical protein
MQHRERDGRVRLAREADSGHDETAQGRDASSTVEVRKISAGSIVFSGAQGRTRQSIPRSRFGPAGSTALRPVAPSPGTYP